ncbi:unnamed protein product [Effrenium voratum]|uniref:type I protein arginine methyltransferase n=1 Tax=Effrenium voratum TaxID=2562239 RepID=A0AA36NFQ6_9DINO|nr:unnamed protein product [Effrenium voratum]
MSKPRRALKRAAGQDGPRWVPKEAGKELSFEDFRSHWSPLAPGETQDYYFSSYARFSIHEDMLKDRVRTGSYQQAIQHSEAVFRGKTVLDVGAGTGILCLFAARAGAKRVIGVECSEIASYATKIAEENGFGDVITYIQGKVEEIELPVDEVDIIISEWMGYFLIFEAMLDSVLVARDRWLRPGRAMFPDRARLFMAGIEDAEYKEDKLGFWSHHRGFDLGPVAQLALQEPISDIVDASALVTESNCVFQMDLTKVRSGDLDFAAPFSLRVQRQDFVHAFVVWFDVSFHASTGGTVLTTAPGMPDTHWKQTVLYLEEPLVVYENDKISGRLAVRKNATNPRDLDVKIAYQLQGQRPQPERVQGYLVRTANVISARNRESRLLAGRLVLGAEAVEKENCKEEVNEDEEFRNLRKQVRQQILDMDKKRLPRTNTGSTEAPLSARRPSRGINTAAAAVLQPSGCAVDPIYFDYNAATRRLREAAQAEKEKAAGDHDAPKIKEMVTFLSSQGLSGPIRAYAKAMALQGVTDPRGLLEADAPKLSKILSLSELESTDELLLLDALRQLR